ncbi:c-type cytochrome [Pseudaestuariivita atlantica]|uniref:Cytochrome c domain-containing protein n=1 Tax=Pseudaestuariivita atlantica TaxID=1317121 RepID=A0A0L1JPW7_9RHOB|nr:c-type cytochrome [Pseudaestuariivita atlantica]KNG93815.1 hypothetical protein ATO11_11640 [Pseudaestuariivita atlantica]
MQKITLTAAMALFTAGCALTPEPRIDAARGERLFAENCAACHGRDARGGGPESLGLGQAPPDLTTLARRNGGTFPTFRVMGKIDGYTTDEDAVSAMPEFGASGLGPTVIIETPEGTGLPVPADLLALVAYLQTVQR